MWDATGPGRPIGMGCMRLSTAPDRDDERSIAVLQAALDTGITFLDTADAYCWSDEETGHNEHLIARALATWTGDRSRLIVATKGGLTRPQGQWTADGRARHLVAACEASRRALGVERIDLYQWHAPDPRTPLATSVRTLASLKRDGLIARVGLCNVTVGQIEEARQIVDIDAVQVELSLWHDDNILSGVVDYCVANRIPVIAHRPLGGVQRGPRIAGDRVLTEIAARHPGATASGIAIAALLDLSDLIVPIPGATRIETATSIPRAHQVRLSEDDRARLDERFPSGERVRRRLAAPSDRPSGPLVTRTDGEIVLIMGLPGAGKSTLARTFVDRGYARVNRDDSGGSLRSLLPVVEKLVETGRTRVVLDNTYLSRKSRAPVLHSASNAGLPVRCLWLATSVDEAQVNAAWRIVTKHGRLLSPEEMKKIAKTDISAFGPNLLFRCQRELEPPHADEGFASIETMPFTRALDASFTNRALIVWCDGVLTEGSTTTPMDGGVLARRAGVLRRYAADGWHLLGLGWQPEISSGSITIEQVQAGYAALRERIGVTMDILFCPHGGGPPICWCRKPLPGLGVVFVHRYHLDPAQCLYVGDGAQDPGFARKLGFAYRAASQFF